MTKEEIIAQFGPREVMEYDIVVVGAGPAGLSAAIRLKQLAAMNERQISVVVLEKGSEPGAHILSGAIMDPIGLNELLPNWRELGAPLNQPVTEDAFLLLSETRAIRTPNLLLPQNFHNKGNYIVSLGNVTRWLAQQAEALGVDIFAGFAAAEVLYTPEGAVRGVATGNVGIGKDGSPTDRFQIGMELHAKYTMFAEGARGHLGREVIAKYRLDEGKDPQSYGIGIKELWEIDPARHKPGLAIHTAGWPLASDTYGGSFVYHAENNQLIIGYVVGLDYQNPHLSPFEEFQRFKTHPAIRWYLEGEDEGLTPAKRLSYGARAITAGGLLSLPKTVFAGGALIGCDAGYLNASRIKGSHGAIKSGMLAAEAAFYAIVAGREHDELSAYPSTFEKSWLYTELNKARNFKQWFKKGLAVGIVMTGVEQLMLRGHIPWTLRRTESDASRLRSASSCRPISYKKPDGKLTFDRLSSVFISNTNHEENQPVHLTLINPSVPVQINLPIYAGPEATYCPAGVYEFVAGGAGAEPERLQINAQNCLHCKTCDIKDPTQNIVWIAPEGGGGPNYIGM